MIDIGAYYGRLERPEVLKLSAYSMNEGPGLNDVGAASPTRHDFAMKLEIVAQLASELDISSAYT